MQGAYTDILSRIDEPPAWFDDNGVPRYGPFSPDMVTCIHANEIVLIRIECQGCQTSFDVAMTVPRASQPLKDFPDAPMLRDYIAQRALHYGDPPNILCCDPGPSMNSIPRVVLEYWFRPVAMGYGLGCHWPRRVDDDGVPYAPSTALLNPRYAMNFQRDPAMEGIDLTPDWAV